MEAGTSVSSIGGGAGASSEIDFYIQGVQSFARKISGNNPSPEGFGVELGAGVTYTTEHVYAWVYCLTPGLIQTRANSGIVIVTGDSNSVNKYHIVNGSEDLVGGWICYPVDPQQAGDTVNGSPSATPDWYGAAIRTTGNINRSNLGIDAIRYGTGIDASGGGTPDPDLTFADIATENDLIANQWGVLRDAPSGFQLQGELRIGIDDASSPTTWSDADSILVKPNNNPSGVAQKTSSTFSGITIQGTATTVTFDSDLFFSLDATDRGFIDCAAAANTSTVSITNCSFFDWGTINGSSGLTFDDNTLTGCGVFTVGGAVSVDSNLFVSCSPVDAGNNLDLIANCSFISPGSGHAVTTSVNSGTLSFVGNSFSGYGADATADAAIHFTATTGSVTVNVSGGAIPTFLSGGVTVSLQLSTTLTLTGLELGTYIRVYETGTSTVVASGDNINTGSFVASISVSSIDIVIFNLGFIAIRIVTVDTTTDRTIPIEQFVDRQYENP